MGVVNPAQKAWPKTLELIPVMAKPKLRMLHASNIFPLPASSEADLQVKIDVPGDPALGDYFTLMFKIKAQKKEFIGPDFILFVKLTEPLRKSDFEEPIDIKTEAENFEIASDLVDEGFGSFDRCLRAVRMSNGNLQESREVL